MLPLDQPIGTVPGRSSPTNGAFSIADTLKRGPRFNNVYRLVEWRDTSPCVTAGGSPTSGGLNVADPRAAWQNAGHYGVVSWGETAGAVTAAASHDNGRNNVADPRPLRLEELGEAPLIVSLDGTWHRPLTTLELAALQGFPTEG